MVGYLQTTRAILKGYTQQPIQGYYLMSLSP